MLISTWINPGFMLSKIPPLPYTISSTAFESASIEIAISQFLATSAGDKAGTTFEAPSFEIFSAVLL
nr:hypothetical protein [Candidatus Kryptonium thompsoni]